jgi:AP-3 complex subunit mu
MFVNDASPDEAPETGHPISLEFSINMFAISGLRVDSLRIYNETYKPYKVRITVHGHH